MKMKMRVDIEENEKFLNEIFVTEVPSVTGGKKCSKCEQWKIFDEFYKDKSRKDGYMIWCKECRKEYKKEYGKKYKEKISKYNKKYREENKEKIREHRKEYYEENKNDEWFVLRNKENYKKWSKKNKEYEKKRGRKKSKNPVKYRKNNTFIKKLPLYGESVRRGEDGFIQVICTYCGGWFIPIRSQLDHRLQAIYGKANGEQRFYCSQGCKDSCPIFYQAIHPKDHKPSTSREVQPQLRQMVLKRDNYTCQKCGMHRDQLEVGLHCHHIDPVINNPLYSADVNNCITLCETCHKWVHQNVPGCGYGELRCSNGT